MSRAIGFGLVLLTVSVLAIPVPAQAGLLGGVADFKETLDLPSFGRPGPRVLQKLGRSIGAGAELTEANEVSNPSYWEDSLKVDLGNFSLTLTPTASNSYQTIQITISNIVAGIGEIITGFTQTAFGAINPSTGPYTITTAFTAHSLTVNYFVNDIPSGDVFTFRARGSDKFSVTTAATVVPEPASFLLLGAGLLGLTRFRRRVA